MEISREELLHTVVQRIMSIMRHMRHPAPPPGETPLSPPQASILFTIAHHKDGVSVKELAELTGVTPGAITQFVDTLVRKDQVTREGDPTDRRVVRLKITESARERFEQHRREHFASFAKVFDVLSDTEIKQLIALMDKIETSQPGKDKLNA
jgi:DNA-binding MarR family transcriptional regulator